MSTEAQKHLPSWANLYEREKGVTGARLHHRAVVLQEEAARAAAAAREAADERDRFVAGGRRRGWIR